MSNQGRDFWLPGISLLTAFGRETCLQHLLPTSVLCPPAPGARDSLDRGNGWRGLTATSARIFNFVARQFAGSPFLSYFPQLPSTALQCLLRRQPLPARPMSSPSGTLPAVACPVDVTIFGLVQDTIFTWRWLASRLCVGAAGVIWPLGVLVSERSVTAHCCSTHSPPHRPSPQCPAAGGIPPLEGS